MTTEWYNELWFISHFESVFLFVGSCSLGFLERISSGNHRLGLQCRCLSEQYTQLVIIRVHTTNPVKSHPTTTFKSYVYIHNIVKM